MYQTGGAGADGSDNNSYHTPASSSYYTYWGTATATLAELQTASGLDMNSVDADPVFNDTVKALHCTEALDGAAMPYAAVMTDFYSALRHPTTPDIGAVEIVTPTSLSLGPDTTICGDSYTLYLYGSGTREWAGGTSLGSGESYTVEAGSEPSDITVSVSYVPVSGGCGAGSDQVVVKLVPDAELADSAHICSGETMILKSNTGAVTGTYMWIPSNAQTQSIEVSQAGIIRLLKLSLVAYQMIKYWLHNQVMCQLTS
jgi:hypothetical protein